MIKLHKEQYASGFWRVLLEHSCDRCVWTRQEHAFWVTNERARKNDPRDELGLVYVTSRRANSSHASLTHANLLAIGCINSYKI